MMRDRDRREGGGERSFTHYILAQLQYPDRVTSSSHQSERAEKEQLGEIALRSEWGANESFVEWWPNAAKPRNN